MKLIPLTRNQFAIVDDADFESLSIFKWYARWNESTRSYYAVRNSPMIEGKQHQIAMHREILGLKFGDKRIGDHKNGNTLDDRRSNLRIATNKENCRNSRRRRHNKSGFKGVCWHLASNKWVTQINVERKVIHLGLYSSPVAAALAYDNAALDYFGEFAVLNFPEEGAIPSSMSQEHRDRVEILLNLELGSAIKRLRTINPSSRFARMIAGQTAMEEGAE